MKLTNITSWLSGTDGIFGMEVYVNAELQKEFRLVRIVKNNDNLIIDSSEAYRTIEAVAAAIPENSSVVLVVNGKGVIHRTFTLKSDDISEVIKTVFPDIKAEDFFCQLSKTTSSGILSLIRKDFVQDIIRQFEIKKINFLSLSLGPFVVADFFKVIGIHSSDLVFDYYHIETDNDGNTMVYKILSENTNNIVDVSGEKVEGIYLNAYSVACIYLITVSNQLVYTRVEELFFDEQIKKHKANILKKRGGLVFLVLILCILLVNFFVFSNLRKQNIAYQDHLAVYQSKLKRLDTLESFINAKKDFIENAGWAEKIILSRQCDLIAQTLPAEIRLTELTIHPINITESRNTKEIVFINKKIIIKGLTKKVVVLNEWLKILPEKTSVKELKMDDYHFDTNTQEGQFKLEGVIE